VGTFAVGVEPHGIAFDGAHMWVANSGGGSVTKLRASDGQLVDSYWSSSSTHYGNPLGVAFDGAHIWVANSGIGRVTKR
jgi:DNA-binding beta-propeller fold protein YncE